MSALTDLFTAMANKIRSKTGTQTTYTPSEMASDGIDDVYDAGVASVPTPTSITPSNASPVTLTANTAVKPTASGKAVASVTNIYPSNSSPVPLGGFTPYIVNSGSSTERQGYAIESFSNIVPSNASPVSLTSGSIVKLGGNGYAVSSYSSKTPSNTSPASLVHGEIYKMSGSGYAIGSYSSKTPSDSNPPSVAANSFIKPTAEGYLVESDPTTNPTLIGTKTVASTSAVTFNLDEGLSNYRYIYVTGSDYDGDKDSSDIQSANNLIKVSWFTAVANRTVTSYFTSGNTGAMYQRTQVMTYVNDTTVKIQNSSAVSRTIKIYGIK